MAALDPPRWTSRSKELTSVEGLESGVKLLRCLLREPTQALAPPESAATFNEVSWEAGSGGLRVWRELFLGKSTQSGYLTKLRGVIW